MWIQGQRQNQNQSYGGIALILEPVNDTFQQKRITLAEGNSIKIGRMTSKSTAPTETNGYFDSKVLSRNHAEVIYRNNQVYIKDLKSSNGTFINGKRLSAEGKESCPIELRHGDDLEFGVDIVNEQDKKLLFRKVAAKVYFSQVGDELYDGINGIEPQKVTTNGHMSSKRRGNRIQQSSNTENSLLAMLEVELERARAESRYLSELGSMLNDATNTLDSRSKRVTFADKAMEVRYFEESASRLEEAQIKLKQTEIKLNEAISAQKEYMEKLLVSDKQVDELKEKYAASEKKVTELEQKCASSEKKISELEEKCTASDNKVIHLVQRCKYSDQKANELEDKCKESESRIRALEDALKGTGQTEISQFKDLEERLADTTNELSSTQYFLDDARNQLKRTEKALHTSQKKCKEFQLFETKYQEAMKTIEELRSVGESYGNRIENRDETIKKFDEERVILLSRIQHLEEVAKKNDTESSFLVERLKRIESLNKNLKEEAEKERERAKNMQIEFDIRVDEEVRRLTSPEGLWRRHKKQESEPIKECEMTNERTTEDVNLEDKKPTKKFKKSLFIKGSIGVVVLGFGAWCLSKFYP
ncbi:cell cycle arrest in response to pheromone-related protein [Rhizophagus clarus]|nr:cell cycle arrest in response to pheromone-related protein [Rhizophagus clarus]